MHGAFAIFQNKEEKKRIMKKLKMQLPPIHTYIICQNYWENYSE